MPAKTIERLGGGLFVLATWAVITPEQRLGQRQLTWALPYYFSKPSVFLLVFEHQ